MRWDKLYTGLDKHLNTYLNTAIVRLYQNVHANKVWLRHLSKTYLSVTALLCKRRQYNYTCVYVLIISMYAYQRKVLQQTINLR